MNQIERGEREGNKEITFTKERCEVLLDIAPDVLGLARVQDFAEQHSLLPKSEFHVTLVGGIASKKIAEALNALPDLEREATEVKIKALADGMDLQPVFTELFYYLRRAYNDPDPLDSEKTIPEIRETIIQLATIPELTNFQKALCELLGIEGEMPALPHVTIYSNSTREDKKQRGIGIYSEEDLAISNAVEINIDRKAS